MSTSGDRTVRLWDLDASRELGRFAGHSKKVNAVAVSPGGNLVLTGGDDAAVRLWDIETRESLATFAHDGRVNAVAFVPGGRLALSAGDDATVRLWDTDAKSEAARFDAGGRCSAWRSRPTDAVPWRDARTASSSVFDLAEADQAPPARRRPARAGSARWHSSPGTPMP